MKKLALLLALCLLLLIVLSASADSPVGGGNAAVRAPRPPQDDLECLCLVEFAGGWLAVETCYYLK